MSQQPLGSQSQRLYDHTQTHHTCRTPLDEWSDRLRDLYLTTHTLKRKASISPKGFESAIPPRKWPQTQVLDRAATGIGCQNPVIYINYTEIWSNGVHSQAGSRHLILLHSFRTHSTFCPGRSQALGLAIECICMFCILLRIKHDYAPKRHNGRDLCDVDAMFAVRLMGERMKL